MVKCCFCYGEVSLFDVPCRVKLSVLIVVQNRCRIWAQVQLHYRQSHLDQNGPINTRIRFYQYLLFNQTFYNSFGQGFVKNIFHTHSISGTCQDAFGCCMHRSWRDFVRCVKNLLLHRKSETDNIFKNPIHRAEFFCKSRVFPQQVRHQVADRRTLPGAHRLVVPMLWMLANRFV